MTFLCALLRLADLRDGITVTIMVDTAEIDPAVAQLRGLDWFAQSGLDAERFVLTSLAVVASDDTENGGQS